MGRYRGDIASAPRAFTSQVPWQLCLVDEAREGDAPLASPYEVVPAGARDTRLAAALLTALGLADEVGGAEAEAAEAVEAAAEGGEGGSSEGRSPAEKGRTEGGYPAEGSVWERLGVPSCDPTPDPNP